MMMRSATGDRQSCSAVKAATPLRIPEEATEIPGVAISVPAAGVHDHHRAVPVAVAVEQRKDDQAVVGDDVAAPAVAVVAVVTVEEVAGGPPVRLFNTPTTDAGDHRGDQAVSGDEPQAGVDQLVDVVGDERLCLHGREELGGVDGLAVVAHAAGPAGQVRGEAGTSRGDHRPPVDEDLRTDLLGDDLPVQLHRPACRRLDAGGEPQVGGVFGGHAHATPPEDGLALDQVVEPGVADLGGRQVEGRAVVGERSQEGEGAADVVVGDHERHTDLVVHVEVDVAELGGDALVGPAFERAAEVDAQDFAEAACVHAVEVVSREGVGAGHADPSYREFSVGSSGGSSVNPPVCAGCRPSVGLGSGGCRPAQGRNFVASL